MHHEPKPPDAGDDQELVRRAAQGDEKAFEALVRLKRERVFWIANRIIGNEEDARDIAQSVFIRLWKVLPQYDPAQSFDTWLYRITVNLAIDQYRSRGPVKSFSPLEEREAESRAARAPATAGGDPLASLTAADLRTVFERLAARLGEKQRAVFVLSQIEGMPNEEIARAMGISPSTVRNHLFQARRSLQEGLRLLYPEYYRAAKGRTELPES